jgi:hypothetical protein
LMWREIMHGPEFLSATQLRPGVGIMPDRTSRREGV